jgi:MFS family permease
VFFLQPVAFGSWLVRIPDVQSHLELGPAGLALALLGMPIGILLTLPFAGRLVGWLGARRILIWGFPTYLCAMMLPAFSNSLWALFATLAILGVSIATLELALNVKADRVEKSSGAMIMSTCHGFWGLGIMAGSLLGSGLAALGLTPAPAIVLVAVLLMPVCLMASRLLPTYPPDAQVDAPSEKKRFGLPGAALLGICFFTLGITMTEGAIADWSAVYLRDVFGSDAALAGLGYSLFALTLALGRFVGDRLKARFGAVSLARVCGVLALAGILVVVTSPAHYVTLIGFALVGLGASVGFPLAVTAAASLTDRPAASSVAVLSFVALIGFLVGPPLIGFVAEVGGLRVGLAMLLPGLVLSLVLTGMLAPRSAGSVRT